MRGLLPDRSDRSADDYEEESDAGKNENEERNSNDDREDENYDEDDENVFPNLGGLTALALPAA